MLDRLEAISRLLCFGLAALLVLQLANAILHGDPLGRVTIPALPTLPASASAEKTNSAPAANAAAVNKTNSPAIAKAETSGKTNSTAVTNGGSSIKTNSSPMAKTDAAGKTNAGPNSNDGASGKTNSPPIAKAGGPHERPPRMTGGKKVDLPPEVQTRVQHIVESEILGPFIRPMPMALFGIAGDNAFLRAPDGQTGMVKEGAELGAIKLLRIGTNRVLVEENGEKKELTLFAGMGGESLLPPETNSIVKTNISMNEKEKH